MVIRYVRSPCANCARPLIMDTTVSLQSSRGESADILIAQTNNAARIERLHPEHGASVRDRKRPAGNVGPNKLPRCVQMLMTASARVWCAFVPLVHGPFFSINTGAIIAALGASSIPHPLHAQHPCSSYHIRECEYSPIPRGVCLLAATCSLSSSLRHLSGCSSALRTRR